MSMIIGLFLLLGLFFPAFWIVIPFLFFLKLTNRAPVLLRIDPTEYDWDDIFDQLMTIGEVVLADTSSLSGSETRYYLNQFEILATTNLPTELDANLFVENNKIILQRAQGEEDA